MRIELILPHEHAGRDYPAGSVIELPKDAAEWLVAIGAARPVTSNKPSKGDSK